MITVQRLPDLDRRIEETRFSTPAFCKFWMPEHFSRDFEIPHYEICEALDDPTIKKVNIVSSRGLGKTSLVLMGYIGRLICHKLARHIVYGTQSEEIALEKSTNLKQELSINENIRAVFPKLKFSQYRDEFEEKFTAGAWVAYGHTLFRARGLRQTFRGLLHRRWRPDVVVIDDSQVQKEIRNEEIRQQDWEKMRGDIEYCVDQAEDAVYKIIHIDTCKHEDGMTEKLDGLPDWKTVRVPVARYVEETKTYVTLYPNMLSQKRLDEMVESARLSSTIDVLAREVLARPTATEVQTFTREHFQYYSEFDKAFMNALPIMDTIVLVDPGKSPSQKSADTAIVVVSIDRFKPAIYVRQVISEKMFPEEIEEKAFDLAEKFNAHCIGLETTGLGKWGEYPFVTQMRTRDRQFNFVPLTAKKGQNEDGKTERVKLMSPFYRRKQVFHNQFAKDINRLEQQLLSFPTPKLWDCMDALAYFVEVLADAERFFASPDIEDEDPEALEREYAELERLDPDDAPFEREFV